jgi:hypothetical protein
MGGNSWLALEVELFQGFQEVVEPFITLGLINYAVVPESDVAVDTSSNDFVVFQHNDFDGPVMASCILIHTNHTLNEISLPKEQSTVL